MKKIFKSKRISNIIFGVLGLVIGGVIFGTLGIVATTNKLEAKYVMYTKDGVTMTVQDAIKDLYVLANNKGGSNQTLPLGTPSVASYTVTVPYTGSYPNIRCVYGTTENYGSVGTIGGNTCTFTGTSSNQTLYYKIVATDNNGKIYENSGSTVTANTSFADFVNVGDYIYMKPTKTSYNISTSLTGYNSNQTINPSELTVWRVIRKNSNGTVDVVSENVSSTNVYFYGQTGYQNFIGTLNTIAAQYTNSDYVQDTRHMGYSNQTQNITNTSKLTQKSAPWKYSTTSVDEALGAGDTGYTIDYNLVKEALGTLVAKKPSGTAMNYWLASRFYNYQNGYYWNFDVRGISHNSSLFSVSLLSGGDGEGSNNYAYAIRPILTLKSTVKIIGGTGTSSDNYKLGL